MVEILVKEKGIRLNERKKQTKGYSKTCMKPNLGKLSRQIYWERGIKSPELLLYNINKNKGVRTLL